MSEDKADKGAEMEYVTKAEHRLLVSKVDKIMQLLSPLVKAEDMDILVEKESSSQKF